MGLVLRRRTGTEKTHYHYHYSIFKVYLTTEGPSCKTAPSQTSKLDAVLYTVVELEHLLANIFKCSFNSHSISNTKCLTEARNCCVLHYARSAWPGSKDEGRAWAYKLLARTHKHPHTHTVTLSLSLPPPPLSLSLSLSAPEMQCRWKLWKILTSDHCTWSRRTTTT